MKQLKNVDSELCIIIYKYYIILLLITHLKCFISIYIWNVRKTRSTKWLKKVSHQMHKFGYWLLSIENLILNILRMLKGFTSSNVGFSVFQSSNVKWCWLKIMKFKSYSLLIKCKRATKKSVLIKIKNKFSTKNRIIFRSIVIESTSI